MLEKLVATKRATSADLVQAQRRLADLKGQVDFKPTAVRTQAVPEPLQERATGPVLEGDEYARLQADLSRELDTLSRRRADQSNQLHLVPESVPCPELTRSILDLTAQIEALWDKKRYLERNHRLPPDPIAQTSSLSALPGNDEGRYQLAYEKRRLIDKRSKLKGKLENPKARPSKRAEWETELAQCELKIREIDVQLSS
ncbi:hypothetical protein [Rudanella lutea]|uniref:hypothetical protein n=1 Tax=Rudanella lutea TaxID=451374 RepID=UPI00036CFA65|nr:hypothetical protein [Rudanella lutea]